ncbi:hypothetical protein GCM10010416_16470 [Streptomyces caniferus]
MDDEVATEHRQSAVRANKADMLSAVRIDERVRGLEGVLLADSGGRCVRMDGGECRVNDLLRGAS